PPPAGGRLPVSLRTAGRTDHSRSVVEAAYTDLYQNYGPGNPDLLACRMSYGLALLATGDTDAAGEHLVAVQEAYEHTLGWRHPHTLACVHNHAAVERTS